MLTVFAEHGWLYRAYRQKWRQNRLEQPAVAMFRTDEAPLSITKYFQRELQYSSTQWKFWLLDASLIVAGAVGVVTLGTRSADSTAQRSPGETNCSDRFG
jgi:hypothetical protein